MQCVVVAGLCCWRVLRFNGWVFLLLVVGLGGVVELLVVGGVFLVWCGFFRRACKSV